MNSKLHGYSERGLVNALCHPLTHRPNGLTLLESLLGYSWPLARYSDPSCLQVGGDLIEADVYVEPSLSQYGNPDAVIITKHKHCDGQISKTAWFVEAKVETFESSAKAGLSDTEWNTDWFQINSSSIVHELFLKARFNALLRQRPAALRDGVRIYEKDKENYHRKLGTDSMVLALATNLTSCDGAWFVALTTDRPPTKGCGWNEGELAFDALCRIDKENQPAGLPIRLGDPRGGWPERTILLAWSDVYEWAKQHNLSELRGALEENEAKLRFQVRRDHGVFEALFKRCGLRANPKKSPLKDKVTWTHDGRAVLTVRVRDGLQDDATAEVYLKKAERYVYLRSSESSGWQTWEDLVAHLRTLIPQAPWDE